MIKFDQHLLDSQAGKIFKLFLEAILAYDQGQAYSSGDSLIMEVIERLIDDAGDIDTFRRTLAKFYFSLERNGGQVRWDSHLKVRDALLIHLNVSLDEYLVAMGRKHHRSIDDPWEPT